MTSKAEKGPTEVLDYTIDYSKEFSKSSPVDQISTSAWAISPAIMTIVSTSVLDTDKAIAKLSAGGNLQSQHRLTNTVVTVGGRTHVRTIVITIRDR